jgi:hypothetical protein
MAEKVVAMEVKLAAVLARIGRQPVNVTAVCADLGISRTSFYKYKARFEAAGIEGLLPRSRRPHHSPGQVPAATEEQIVRLRKERADAGWDNGAVSIGYAMVEQGLDPPAAATIHRVLRRRGLVRDQPAKRPRAAYRRFEYPAANDCWQIDAFGWELADGTGVVIFQIIDDHSRLETDSFAAPAETGVAAWACWIRAIERHGVPAMALSDNGTAFSGARRGWTAEFERNVRALGTATVTSSPYHPQTCGKDERAHRTLQQWLRARPAPATLADLQDLLDTYRPLYNARPHQGIDGQTPHQRFTTSTAHTGPLPTQPQPDHTGPLPTQPQPDHTGPSSIQAKPAVDEETVQVEPPQRSEEEQPGQPTSDGHTQHRGRPPVPEPTHTTHPLVSTNGVIAVDGHAIAIGTRYTRTRPTVIRQADHVAIFHGHTLIRELTLDRTRHYQPSGNTPGGPKHPRVLSTMS